MAFEAGVAYAGGMMLWEYNRSNFLFDREMRLKREQAVLKWRNKQAGLWRDDIREVIGLTEEKMGVYLIVAVLTIRTCVSVLTEGRLPPGSPRFLLNFLMLSLGTTLMYLLMSVWFSMHAIVVARSSSVRLLTQFVRKPIPTWVELHEMRTFGQAFENGKVRDILKVPFATTPREAPVQSSHLLGSSLGGVSTSGGGHETWDRDSDSKWRNAYELQPEPIFTRRHIKLAQQATLQYQCYDAFSRVAMTFGVNQLLQAMCSYSLGYLVVQANVLLPAASIVIVFAAISLVLMHLDWSLSARQASLGQGLLIATFSLSLIQVFLWQQAYAGNSFLKVAQLTVLPLAYFSQGFWLLWALLACDIREQRTGALLPVNFRAVLYMDIFGWIQQAGSTRPSSLPLSAWGNPSGQTEQDNAAPLVGLPTPSGEESIAPDNVFDPSSYLHAGAADPDFHLMDGIVTGYERLKPGYVPGTVFRMAAILVIALWFVGGTSSLQPLCLFFLSDNKGSFAVKLAEETRERLDAAILSNAEGNPELEVPDLNPAKHTLLQGAEPLELSWPPSYLKSNFLPFELHGLACSAGDENILVASNFKMFLGKVVPTGHGNDGVNFVEMSVCPSITGSPLEDVDMYCDPVVGCMATVLQLSGSALVECPLRKSGSKPPKLRRPVPPPWSLPDNWLRQDPKVRERIAAVAVNGSCLISNPRDDCSVVVGTSYGRVVILRSSSNGQRKLLPRSVIHRRLPSTSPKISGKDLDIHYAPPATIGMLRNGAVVLALWQDESVVSAFRTDTGERLGEWRLPMGIKWINICSNSRTHLLVLGERRTGAKVIFRIPLPEELRTFSP